MKTIYTAFKIGCVGFTDGMKNIMQGKWKDEWEILTSPTKVEKRVSFLLAK